MALDNYGVKILRENCTSNAERYELDAILESNTPQLDATMVSRLYKSAIDKAHMFDTWEDSRGDITKFEGYASMRESLNIVTALSNKAGVNVKEVITIEESLGILEANREAFMKGFLINNELVILIYNTIAFACVEATTAIISSYVEFVRDVNSVEFKIVRNGKVYGHASISNLENFNRSHKKGDLGKLLKEATSNRDNFLGTSAATIAIPVFILGISLAIVPAIRELVFLFYYSRSRMSEYLEQQAILIELNKANVENSKLPLKERNAVVKKQAARSVEFRKYADKFRVNTEKGEREATMAIKAENKTWSLKDTKDEMLNDQSNGFQLL